MEMSEEMAVRLHRMMWSDMQKELGDNPNGKERAQFKFAWIHKHFPSESIANDCWLCEYASSVMKPGDSKPYCKYCPISWPNCHCNTLDFSYAEEPISEILALPAKNVANDANDDEKVVYSYYKYREELLSKASGIPASSAIEGHVKAIQEKAVQQSNLSKIYGDTKMELAKASGHPAADAVTDHILAIRKKAREEGFETAKEYLAECSGLNQNEVIFDHIRAIKEKAVEECFANTPGAKFATMDVDDAFKQYADEQKAPIFRALAEASGLSSGNESVKEHISLIRDTAKQNGRMEKCKEIFDELSESSGLSKGNWCLSDHVKAIQEKAKAPMEPLRSANMLLVDTLNRYKDTLSKASDLDRNRPVDDHIREIVKNAMELSAAEERDRIQEKVYEVLLS